MLGFLACLAASASPASAQAGVDLDAPAPAPSTPPAPTPARVPLHRDDAARERAIAFVDGYFRWSAENAQALAALPTLYAPTVDFYGKPTLQSVLLAQKRAYMARWPSRSYIVRPGTLEVACEMGGAVCTVSGLVDWDCRSAARNARSAGTASFALRVAFTGGDGVILSESGAVVARRAAP